MKEGFKSIEEILKEVGEDENMSEKEMKDVWEHQKAYIKKQMDREEVYAIFLPYLGTLALNVKQYRKEIKGRIRSRYQSIVDKIAKLKDHENFTEFANSHKKVTGVNRLARKIIRDYHTEIEIPRKLIAHKKCWGIIEKYSNGVYEKRKVKLVREEVKKQRQKRRMRRLKRKI